MPIQQPCSICGEIVDPLLMKFCEGCSLPFCDKHYIFIGKEAFCDKCYNKLPESKKNPAAVPQTKSIRKMNSVETDKIEGSGMAWKIIFVVLIVIVLAIFGVFWFSG